MKKVLFATTALIATAGVAAADITLTGDARMGIVHTDRAGNVDNETAFSSRARLSIAMSGETDNGISFGASFRADNAPVTPAINAVCIEGILNDAVSEDEAVAGLATCVTVGGAANGLAGNVFISGAFGRLSMGDVGPAHESATGDVAGVGYTMTRNEMGYIAGNDDPSLAYTYSIEGLTLHASLGQRQADDANNEVAFGAAYKFGDFTVAAGYAEEGNVEQTSIALRGSLSGVSFAVVSLDNKNHATVKGELGASVSYTMDALTLTAFTREVDNITGTDPRYTGIGARYNLGGGAALAAGFVDGGANGDNLNTWDLGMTFSF